MSRPIRIEFPGALYHVTSRGDRREAIYEDDTERERFLELLGQVVTDFNWLCHAYCLMTNHYHLVIETPDGKLSKGMRQLNGVYTQHSNRRHGRTGHLFEGRFKSILVDADSYLLELARYVVLNPVRAGMVHEAGDWAWSSYGSTVGLIDPPNWLTPDAVLAAFSSKRPVAARRYQSFVAAGVDAAPVWDHLQAQAFLGDEEFAARTLRHSQASDDVNIPKAQRRPAPPSLDEIARNRAGRDEAIVAAHATGRYSYQQIADYFGVHFTTVGRIVRLAKRR